MPDTPPRDQQRQRPRHYGGSDPSLRSGSEGQHHSIDWAGSGAGSGGDAQGVELGTGLGGFWGRWEALDEGAEFADAGFLLLELNQGLALVEVGGGDLVVVGELLEDFIVVVGGVGELAGAIVDLAQVVEGIAREGVVGVSLDDVLELGGGYRVLG